MKILQTILDRILTAPGEAPGGALVQRTSSTSSVSSATNSAGKPMLREPGRKPSSPSPTSTVYLLLDVSGSMDEGKLRQARDGGLSFAEDAVSKGYRVGVIHFTTWARLKVAPTTNLKVIREGLSKTGLQLTTNIAAAIQLATEHLGQNREQRAIVLVTDGYPDDAEAALKAATEAKRRDITIIAIGTDDADRLFLKKIASASGLAKTVPDAELKVAIASAARLLPAKTASSK